ncbi:hypothetical protein [Cognatishimia maritima]|uniref:Cytochrome C oxidase assembly protein n=1 Tax=Cognatishimia maritima TaxID=870908 RepID=A0A1M5VCS3_9RHOB|nr:hypothetical protein [Cognatishimia maritima]SHH73072.1 hypothetical protein SAMN04488044_3121 [Cognatishimia maritima]
MNFPEQHELHKRRFGRNLGVALALAAFVVLLLGLTVVKVTRGDFEPASVQQGATNG